jgi:ABC-type antimicrobial peptide transport system permease subunit
MMRLDQLARDIGYGLRQLRRNPGFSGIAIATLALGIGVNTAMFSAVDQVLIRPLPYADAGRLVMISTLFYGFQPDYVPAVATVSLVLLAVAALAVLIPARRASRIDPMIALQHE